MSGNGHSVWFLVDGSFTLNHIYQLINRVPTKSCTAIFFESTWQFHIILAAMLIDANDGLSLSGCLSYLIINPRTLMGVLTNHHNEGLGPADADTQVAGNRSIRYLIRAVFLLLHRTVTSITTVIPQALLERIQLLRPRRND